MPSTASAPKMGNSNASSYPHGGNVMNRVLEHCCIPSYDTGYQEVRGIGKGLAERTIDRPVVLCLGSWLAIGGELGHTIASFGYLSSSMEVKAGQQCLNVEGGRVSAINLAIAQAVLIAPAILCLLPYSCLASCCHGARVTYEGIVVQVVATVVYLGMVWTLLGLSIWIGMSGCYEKTEGVEGMAIFAGMTTLGLLVILAHSVVRGRKLAEAMDEDSDSASTAT